MQTTLSVLAGFSSSLSAFASGDGFASSLSVPAGATLGHASGWVGRLYWYILSNGSLAVSCRDFGQSGRASVTLLDAGSSDCMVMYCPTSAGSFTFTRIGLSRDLQATAGQWTQNPAFVWVSPYDKPLGAFHAYPVGFLGPYAPYDRDTPMKCDGVEFNTGEYDPSPGRWCLQPEEPSYWSVYGVYCWDKPPPWGWIGNWMFLQPGAGQPWQETSGNDNMSVQNDPYPRVSEGSSTARTILLRPTNSLRYHVGHATGASPLYLTSALGTWPPGGPARNTINYFEGHQLATLVG